MTQNRKPPEPEIFPPGHGPHGQTARGGGSENLGEQVAGLMRNSLTTPRAAYTLYALAAVSGFPMLVGLIVAYVARTDAPQWLQSHYTFLIRTFWYFVALIVIGAALAFFLVGFMLWWVLPLWLVIRVVRGWLLLENRKPVPDPQSWLFS